MLVTAPDVAREIIKFALHAIIDPNLIEAGNEFQQFFAASSGFKESTLLLLRKPVETLGT